MEVLGYLSDNLQNYIKSCGWQNNITEIRLRANRKVQFTVNGKQETAGYISVSQKEIEDILYAMCQRSMNVYEDEISKGYVTLKNGHRVGLGGEFYYNSKAEKYLLKQVKSLNIRIAKDVAYFENQDKLFCQSPASTLVVGPPHSGKTSFLKLYARIISENYRVVICDERAELVVENLDCDVLQGIKKADAIAMATRTLNPQFIICDEIGSKQEAEEILSAVNTGVNFICSVHGENVSQILRRPGIKLLIDNKVFDTAVMLRQKNGSFFIEDIRDV